MIKKNYYSILPKIYDDQFWWKKDDIEFWKKIFNNKKNTILELAAGTGRLAIPLIREQNNYTGLELSKEYCTYANNQIQLISRDNKIIQGDMREFNLNQQFDNIFIGFNSLLHLLNEKELIEALDCVKKHMHKKSYFYIDIFVPHTLFLSRRDNETMKVCEFFDSVNNNASSIYEELSYDEKKEIMNVKWSYKTRGKTYKNFMFKMKMYYPDTMNRILIEQGFKIKALWGDYNKSTFHAESPLQIYKCYLKN